MKIVPIQKEIKEQNSNPFLTIEGLCKSFQEGSRTRKVLHDMTLMVNKAEIVAILGKSGSGKTTLLNLISGIDILDCGEIWLDGVQLTALNDHQRTLFRREKIGHIFQFFNLIPTLTVLENVLLPLELNGKMEKKDRESAVSLLQQVGLPDRLNTFPDRLSGGEQQRVAIARALVHDPLLVLADEPTGNLDEDTGQQVLELVEKLTRQSGKNLIMVTHSQEAAGIADRIFSLRDGHMEEISEGKEG